MPIPVQCSHCLCVLKLKDEAVDSLGKKMRCPKCGEAFVTKRHRERDVEEIDEYQVDEDDEEEEAPRRRSSKGSQASRRGRGAAAKKATPDSGAMKKGLSIGGAVLAVLLIIGKVLLRNAPVAEQQPPLVNPPVVAMPGMAQPPGNSGAPITDAEYEAFAKQFEANVKATQGNAFAGAINWEKLLNKSMVGLELNPQFVTGFRRGVLGSLSTGMSAEIAKNLNANGHYRFLRLHTVGTEKRILFRMSGDQGLNYHDFELERNANGQIEATDMYIFLSGEKFSETMRRLVVLGAVSQKGSFLQRLTGKLGDFEAHAATINSFNAQKASGQFVAALATYRRLPVSLQQEKTFALTRVMVASQCDEAEYLAALTDFRQAFPNDACVDFLSLDFFFLRKEFDKCLIAIDRVDQSVGGDPYLNSHRVGAYMELGKFAEARQAAELAIKAEPTLTEPLFTLAGVGLKEGNHAVVLDAMKRLRTTHNQQFEDLRTVPEYSEFVKSPEFQEWLRISM